MATSHVKGGAVIRKRLRKISRNVAHAVNREMDDIADEVLTGSRDAAPQLTGEMIRTSGIKKGPSGGGRPVTRTVYYSEEYAPIQHNKQHNPGPVTAAKLGDRFGVAVGFLRKPFNKVKPKTPARVAHAVRTAIRQSLR